MIKTELYIRARKNEKLDSRHYFVKEIKEIVQAQFHYFWYNVNLGKSLEQSAFSEFDEKFLKDIKTQVLVFQSNNMYIFSKKNELKLFNTVILHLLLSKKFSHLTNLTKI